MLNLVVNIFSIISIVAKDPFNLFATHSYDIVESILQEYFQVLKMDTNVAISNGASKIVEEESSEGNDVHKVLDTDTLDEVT